MRVDGESLYLQMLTENDVYRFTQLLIRNKHYWSMFEPRFSDSYYTVEAQRDKLRQSLQQFRNGREFNFGIYERDTNALVGHISLYNVKRLPFSSGFVGYSIDEEATGKGYATEAVHLLVRYAIHQVGLHRVEAYVSPHNIASIRVLEKALFVREGLLRELIFINGNWEDHYMYALLANDYVQQS